MKNVRRRNYRSPNKEKKTPKQTTPNTPTKKPQKNQTNTPTPTPTHPQKPPNSRGKLALEVLWVRRLGWGGSGFKKPLLRESRPIQKHRVIRQIRPNYSGRWPSYSGSHLLAGANVWGKREGRGNQSIGGRIISRTRLGREVWSKA